jgi:type II secretory pathway pseudopilin PulG
MMVELHGERFEKMTRCWRPEAGVGLAETLIAVAILSLTTVALLSAFSTGTLALNKGESKSAAENLARNQLEFVKSQPYLPLNESYLTMTPVPAGYSVSTRAESVDGRDEQIQKVTVEVQRNGSVVFTLEGLKLDQ